MTKQELEAISNSLIQAKWKPKGGDRFYIISKDKEVIIRDEQHLDYCIRMLDEKNIKEVIWLTTPEDLKEIARERLEKKGLVIEGMRHPKSDRTMDAWEQINYWFDAWYDHEQMVFNKSITEWLYNSTTELEALARWVIYLEGE